jgi:hypothetical protein
MSRKLSLALSAALLAATAASSVQAADRDFCRNYARAAVNQVRGAMSHGRCRFRVEDNPTRWSTDFRVHFEWCRDVSRDQADDEREARRRALEHCARWR